MKERIYKDPEAGTVLLRKSPVSRRMSVRVHPVNGISVVMPEAFSYEEGLRFFLSRKRWVMDTMARQKLKEESARRSGKAVGLLHDGSSVRTLMSEIIFRKEETGSSMKVVLEVEQLVDVKAQGRSYLSLQEPIFRKTFICQGTLSDETPERLDRFFQGLLVEELRKEAKTVLPAKLSFLARRFGFSYNRLTIKHNSSNWGSCSSRRNINLNLNLVRVPEALCDYVLLHELSHLRHPDHGAGFHDLLEKLCTDNIARLSMTGDPEVMSLIRKINASRSSQPVHKTMERELKAYRLV